MKLFGGGIVTKLDIFEDVSETVASFGVINGHAQAFLESRVFVKERRAGFDQRRTGPRRRLGYAGAIERRAPIVFHATVIVVVVVVVDFLDIIATSVVS